jgi:flagellar L-ring protein precursor FlgH
VGDTLTVNLVEKTEAKRKSETTDERKANASRFDIPAPVICWVTARRHRHDLGTLAPATSRNSRTTRPTPTSFKGAITVTVVEVLANGHLVVAGEKQVAINNDTEYIRLAGVVNPAQITAGNTINSTQLANAQFESKNTQSIDTSQVGSMLARFFLTILPF